MPLFNWRPPTHDELMAAYGPLRDAQIAESIVDLTHDGPRHQPRLAAGTRVRVRELVRTEPAGDLRHVVDVCDARGIASGYWAVVDESQLCEAPPLGFLDWLRSRVQPAG